MMMMTSVQNEDHGPNELQTNSNSASECL